MTKTKITFLGDIMCSIPETAISKGKNGQYDYTAAFAPIKSYLDNSDYVVGNLETPIAGHEMNYTSETTLFNTPVEFVQALKKAGVDMVTTANNHALDRGLLGLERTIDNLRALPIEFTGTRKSEDDNAYLVKNFNGFRVAFIAYTYGTDSNWRNNALEKEEAFHLNYYRTEDEFPMKLKTSKRKEFLKLVVPEFIKRIGRDSTYPDCGCIGEEKCQPFEQMISLIRKAKDDADYVIMCLHIGGQYNNDIGEYTRFVVERCKEAGCDAIIGNHPHCVQKSEQIENGFIAYALGNFYCTPHYGYYVDGVFADYSIVLNLHFDTEKRGLEKVTFSVAKSVIENGRSVVKFVNDLKDQLVGKERNLLIDDNASVVSRFLGNKNKQNIPVNSEYDYKSFVS